MSTTLHTSSWLKLVQRLTTMNVSKWFSQRLDPSFSTWQWGLVSSIACQKSGETVDGDVQKQWLYFRPTRFAQLPQHSLGKRLHLPKSKASFRPHCDSPFALTQRSLCHRNGSWQKSTAPGSCLVNCAITATSKALILTSQLVKVLTLIWSPRPGSPESLTWFVLIKPSITHREKEKKLPF